MASSDAPAFQLSTQTCPEHDDSVSCSHSLVLVLIHLFHFLDFFFLNFKSMYCELPTVKRDEKVGGEKTTFQSLIPFLF